MPGLDFNQLLTPARVLPSPTSDSRSAVGPPRGGRYMEQYVLGLMPDMGCLADEGSYFTANNGQTGIATAAALTTFSNANPFILIYNRDSAAKDVAKRIMMDYASLIVTAAGTAGVSVQFAILLDQGNRYLSGGTNLTSLIVNPNGDSGLGSIANVYVGNIVANTSSPATRVIVGNRYMKGAIPAVGDTYAVKFGGVDCPTFIGASGIVSSLNNVPKIIIPPNWTMTLHLWLPSQSAASSYAPELGWVER